MTLIAKTGTERTIVRTGNRERYGTRDMTYSNWHRDHYGLGMVDIDHVELCLDCHVPLALIETAIDIGQSIFSKKAGVMRNLAIRADLPAYIVLYRINTTSKNIDQVRYVKIRETETKISQQPNKMGEVIIHPSEWADRLWELHLEHQEFCTKGKRKV